MKMIPEMDNPLKKPVQFLKGVGPKKAELFAKLGIRTVADILWHIPLRYEDRRQIKTISQLEIGRTVVVRGFVKTANAIPRRGRGMVFEVLFSDNTGVVSATWFHFSKKAMEKRFVLGSEWIVTGKAFFNKYRGSKSMVHPETESVTSDEELTQLGQVIPVYSLTEGLNQRAVRKVVKSALALLKEFPDFVPEPINRSFNLPSLTRCIKLIHAPPEDVSFAELNEFETPEQKKLIFNELFLLQAGIAIKRNKAKVDIPGSSMKVSGDLLDKIRTTLPFKLTDAQERCLSEIAKDMSQNSPMNRLLQGDVGSGKTAIAFSASLIAVRNKKQVAIMAPTEILARQHYKNITALLGKTQVCVKLLISGMKEKAETLSQVESGAAHIVIGTHAIIQEGVLFKSLGLAVIDEQHRFGVQQRADLFHKGDHPNVLIMTATPIPRTLSMTVYGDLDISTIDELPPGRIPIETRLYTKENRVSAIETIRSQVVKGNQAYIVYPLVEESENLDLQAATVMFAELQETEFKGMVLGLIHGRMKGAEKDEVIERFSKGEINILVSTTVIEVGVDQTNATVMMIEHAEMFGLSQLNQLWGRVGRGTEKSYCLLIANLKSGSPACDRLKIMEGTEDGFKIAEADLAHRGAGDFFGARQWGAPELKITNIFRDQDILKKAKKAAFLLVDQDPGLDNKANHELCSTINLKWRERFQLGEIG